MYIDKVTLNNTIHTKVAMKKQKANYGILIRIDSRFHAIFTDIAAKKGGSVKFEVNEALRRELKRRKMLPSVIPQPAPESVTE